MCLAKAFLKKDGKDELLLENVASLEAVGNKIILNTLFRETKEIEASIKMIDFASNSRVILESVH